VAPNPVAFCRQTLSRRTVKNVLIRQERNIGLILAGRFWGIITTYCFGARGLPGRDTILFGFDRKIG
jgi:hypothetical protein